MRVLVVSLVAACTVGESSTRPAPLDPLPPPSPVTTAQFRDAEACGQCHLAGDDTPVLHDATGANASPVLLWRSSMMALAARDPYYLASFAEELAAAPDRADALAPLCTRCHAPAGSEELAATRSVLGFDELVAGTSDAAVLGRGGVTCTLCHQIGRANLGDESSFSGGFVVGYDRTIFGRYANPMASPMQLIVSYTPTLGTHVESSALCATCHVVIVGKVVEQATFLEWRASSYAGAAGQSCQDCHVPTIDDAQASIATPISVFPAGLAPQQPFGRHLFVGGNSYVLSLLADAGAWSGAAASPAEIAASAARDVAHLATAAGVTVAATARDPDGTAVVTIHVENRTGHKLPTGYPSRRMWLHVTASAGGGVVFESGGTDASGAIVDTRGAPLAQQSHHDVIDSGDLAQIWEAILIDAEGQPTHRALDALRYDKDDRILPAGFAPIGADAARTAPIGTGLDASFVAGSDDVTYRIADAPAGLTLSIDLCFEALRPEIVDAIDASATRAGTRFVDLARARAVAPVVIAHVDGAIP